MCLKQKSGTRAAGECVTDVFTALWCPLWSVTEQTHGNMESICFVQSSEKKKDRFPLLYSGKIKKEKKKKKEKKERKKGKWKKRRKRVEKNSDYED